MSWDELSKSGLPHGTKAVVNLAGQNVLDSLSSWTPKFQQLVSEQLCLFIVSMVLQIHWKPFARISVTSPVLSYTRPTLLHIRTKWPDNGPMVLWVKSDNTLNVIILKKTNLFSGTVFHPYSYPQINFCFRFTRAALRLVKLFVMQSLTVTQVKGRKSSWPWPALASTLQVSKPSTTKARRVRVYVKYDRYWLLSTLFKYLKYVHGYKYEVID